MNSVVFAQNGDDDQGHDGDKHAIKNDKQGKHGCIKEKMEDKKSDDDNCTHSDDPSP